MNLLATDARLETDELQATSILDLNTDWRILLFIM
jgi:hypothetical protein